MVIPQYPQWESKHHGYVMASCLYESGDYKEKIRTKRNDLPLFKEKAWVDHGIFQSQPNSSQKKTLRWLTVSIMKVSSRRATKPSLRAWGLGNATSETGWMCPIENMGIPVDDHRAYLR